MQRSVHPFRCGPMLISGFAAVSSFRQNPTWQENESDSTSRPSASCSSVFACPRPVHIHGEVPYDGQSDSDKVRDHIVEVCITHQHPQRRDGDALAPQRDDVEPSEPADRETTLSKRPEVVHYEVVAYCQFGC